MKLTIGLMWILLLMGCHHAQQPQSQNITQAELDAAREATQKALKEKSAEGLMADFARRY